MFGEWLKSARVEAGLSQRELAAMMGWKQSVLSRIENGLAHGLSRNEVVKLSGALGKPETEALSAAGYIAGEAKKVVLSDDEAAIIAAYRKGDDTARRIFSTMAREIINLSRGGGGAS